MKYMWLASLLCLQFSVSAQQKTNNIQFRSQMEFPGILSNIGGYASSGKEYALVGTYYGLTIVNVTNPLNPVKIQDVPGSASKWREVKTYKNFAFVTTEGWEGGVTILNLTTLPDTVIYKKYIGDGEIDSLISTVHALHVDTTKGFLYLYGSNVFNSGAIILDIQDPWNPKFVGSYETKGYVHDGYVDNDTLYACHIYEGVFRIVDMKNKKQPKILASQGTPLKFTHNSWPSINKKVLFTTDEKDSSYLATYDISNFSDIKLLDKIQSQNPNTGSIVHNTHILNNYAINSYYTDGVTIVDASKPDNLVNVGYYDTSPLKGRGFVGCWGVYPYLPSGNLVVSDIQRGLFVLTPTYKRACYLEGAITDSISGNPINEVRVEILGKDTVSDFSNVNGIYKTGIGDSGTYTIRLTHHDYDPKTIKNITLKPGSIKTLNTKMFFNPPVNNINQFKQEEIIVQLAPHPFTGSSILSYSSNETIKEVVVKDITGRQLSIYPIGNMMGQIPVGENLSVGIYILELRTGKGILKTEKLIKQ